MLVASAYLTTLTVAVITTLIIMAVMGPRSCSTLAWALPVLWGVNALIILTSIAGVSIAAWNIITGTTARILLCLGYALVMLITYFMIAFGLMIAFNC